MSAEIQPILPTSAVPSNQETSGRGVGNTNMSTNNAFETPPIELVTSVEQMLSSLPSPKTSQNCSIFRVPLEVRRSNEKAYTPQLISIGPLHRKKPELAGMEEYKKRCLKEFLGRTAMPREKCLGLILGLQHQVKSCYAETIEMDSDEFVKMVLVDCGFIIESALKYWSRADSKEAWLDLILVENQLPFFVLDRIYDLAFTHYPLNSTDKPPPPLVPLLVKYLAPLRLILNIEGPNFGDTIERSEVKHIADLVRMLHVPRDIRDGSMPFCHSSYKAVRAASSLVEEAGVRFTGGYKKPGAFLEMKYKGNGVLEIKPLILHCYAEVMLKNMIALEYHSYKEQPYIFNCVLFMDDLIGTGKDVDILVNSEVIRNYFGESKAVADMFNRLTSQYQRDSKHYHLYNIASRMNSYYNNPRHKWTATLKRDYCSTPFRVASIYAATILLVLTIMQTAGTIVGLSKEDTKPALTISAKAVAAVLIAPVVGILLYTLFRTLLRILPFVFCELPVIALVSLALALATQDPQGSSDTEHLQQ